MIAIRHFIPLVRRLHVKKDFSIYKVTKRDLPVVEAFVEEHYYKNDPCCIMTNVASKPRPSALLLDDVTECVDHGMSFMAKFNEADPRILGLALNIIRPAIYPAGYLDTKLSELVDEKEKNLVEFWSHIGAEPRNLPKAYFGEEKRIVEIRYVVVHPQHQRMGIARELLERTRQEVMNNGYKFLRAEATSAYSSRLCSEAGMKLVYQLRYEDYKNSKGVHIFKDKVAAPHTSLWIYMEKF